MRTLKILGVILFVVALGFTRFYNLSVTTRFTRDESSNLVDMHRIWKEKDITLIGPIDVNNRVVYSSLTHYIFLPFAVLGNFSPASPAYGMALYGILTVVLLILLAWKINKKFIFLIAILGLTWYPLVESSRWAWNPHPVPLAFAFAIFLWLKKDWRFKFLAGIFFGLAFSIHFFSIISFAAFWMVYALQQVRNKKFKEAFFMGLGFAVTLIPFVVMKKFFSNRRLVLSSQKLRH